MTKKRQKSDHGQKPSSSNVTGPITTLFSILTVAGLIGLAVYSAKMKPLFSFCILWFLGNLVIESSVIALDIIFEHRTYLPSMLMILMFVLLVYRLKGPKWLGIGALCTVTLIFSYWTYERNGVWRDDLTLWADCAKKSPNKARPQTDFGVALWKRGKIKEAVDQYTKALRINPNYIEAHNNLGITLNLSGKKSETIDHYLKGIRIKPEYAEAHNSLGAALASMGKMEKAASHFIEALQIKPDYPEARRNRDQVLRLMNQSASAEEGGKGGKGDGGRLVP